MGRRVPGVWWCVAVDGALSFSGKLFINQRAFIALRLQAERESELYSGPVAERPAWCNIRGVATPAVLTCLLGANRSIVLLLLLPILLPVESCQYRARPCNFQTPTSVSASLNGKMFRVCRARDEQGCIVWWRTKITESVTVHLDHRAKARQQVATLTRTGNCRSTSASTDTSSSNFSRKKTYRFVLRYKIRALDRYCVSYAPRADNAHFYFARATLAALIHTTQLSNQTFRNCDTKIVVLTNLQETAPIFALTLNSQLKVSRFNVYFATVNLNTV
ncbi:hypothetical protein TcasGA2_TC004118 [Tribolium castaneum]|uniref:Uncharacterized protein n=1 Tax=Tribolium castaneum TaxID=7070 RepID=D6W6R2_TRICA|nr:hypothetical protein TcasGA2_TC004118 [Tribolium castaneum]